GCLAMRQWAVPVLGISCCLFAGCLSGKSVHTSSWLQPFQHFQSPAGSNGVQIDYALLEGPMGDPLLNQELWTLADDQIMNLEQKAILEENGFRVGQVGGQTPSALQKLLNSEHSCADPRRLQIQADKATRLPLGPVIPQFECRLIQDEQKVPLQLEQADCGLVIVPMFSDDGRIRLRFTPEIKHGKAAVLPQPMDRAIWVLQKQQATETFSQLSWEVTLAGDEFLIVGSRFDRPDTLGHSCFIRADQSRPQQ